MSRHRRPRKLLDLTGQVFSRLTVLRRVPSDKHGKAQWLCLCVDGNEVITSTSSLRRGNTQSCGCLQRDHHFLKHGQDRKGKRSVEYDTWAAMIQRCTNPNHWAWRYYGGRGIKVCKRWRGKYGFEKFFADMGLRPVSKTLDRFPNGDGNYELSNCRWATRKEQTRGRRATKLTLEKVRQIRRLLRTGVKRSELAKQFSVSKETIRAIDLRKTWAFSELYKVLIPFFGSKSK